MVEKVSTGGNISFNYKKGNMPKLSEEQKKEIKNAYMQATIRKKREKIKKIILISMIILLVILSLIFLI